MKLTVVEVPSIKTPIMESPGFAKKELSTYKLDLMALCGFGCSYCSSNSGNYLRMNREKFAALTKEQTGELTYPSDNPGLTFTWPDVLVKLRVQIDKKPITWGAGHTLVLSMLTDAFSPLSLADGTTASALDMVMKGTAFRVRVLTKGAAVASPRWIEYFKRWPGRFTIGLSIGTLDDSWAHKIEAGTSSPTARLRAHAALQEAGVPTYGMLCPIFPDVLADDRLDELIDKINPSAVEHVWAEPYNDRANWAAVRAGYPEGSRGWQWLTEVFANKRRDMWSGYAAELYERLLLKSRREGWAHKLRYLLYEDGICSAHHATAFAGLEGVLLQSRPDVDGLSTNPHIAKLQRDLRVREMPKGE